MNLAAQLRQALSFCVVGLVNTIIAGIVIAALCAVGVSPFIANFLGYAAGTAFSFHANARWTFAAPGVDTSAASAARFLVVTAAAYFVNVAVLALLLRKGVGTATTQALAMVAFTAANFAGQRMWTFRARNEGQP